MVLKKAEEAQARRHGGQVIWRSIRDIQRGRQELVPIKCVSVGDEKGKYCETPQQQQERWRRHFTQVLNIHSQVDASEIEKAEQQPLRPYIYIWTTPPKKIS